MAFTYKSNPLAPSAGSPFHAKAILEPSGEKAGEVARPGRAVNGTAVKASCFCGLWSPRHRYVRTAARITTKMIKTPVAIFNHFRRELDPRSGSTLTTGSGTG